MAQPLIDSFKNASLKNKIFFSVTVVILLISLLIAMFTRWILISTLTSELKLRGLGIGYSIAESCRSHLLTENVPQLTSLIFDARLGARRELVGYVFILGKQDRILAHTFIREFPQKIVSANPIDPDKDHRIQLLNLGRDEVWDVAVAVNEGIYRIGAVHVGLYKKHIDVLINKLRSTFLGFISVVILFFFIISHLLAKLITRPMDKLTRVSDDISRGVFDVEMELENGFESRRVKDEVRQLSRSFINMANRIKDSQAKLKESDNKYRSLFASGPNPIFVLDRRSLAILSANPSALDTYGYTRDELVGRSFTDLGTFVHDVMWDTSEGQQVGNVTTVSSKVQYSKKNGEAIYVNVHACPVYYEDKQALIVATTDITEMVEKDSQLIQASKMTTLGEMSAGIAHELNQPLNAIKMGSEFLEMMIEKKTSVSPSVLCQIVHEMSDQVDRAEGIIRRLRDFGRKTDFTRQTLVINDPILSVLDIIGRQLRLQNIDIRLQLTDDLPSILADHNRLEQVIFNLLTNARDAINLKDEDAVGGGHPRSIIIRSYPADHRVVASVSDNGIGIDPAIKDQIFEAFFTTKKMGEGMGLGLSITNGIVEDYDGEIRIESTEGQGTTVYLSFPVASPMGTDSIDDKLVDQFF